jgi:two-component system LytT family response regulator
MDEPSRSEPIRTLIVDDEPLARERLDTLLAPHDDVEVVARAEDGAEAITAIESSDLDLVFLDVQMPGRSGLDVVEAVGPAVMPLTVFVTAYDDYAVDAFEMAAVDYLLKPFDDDRFEGALDRARQRLDDRERRQVTNRLRRLLDRQSERDGTREDAGRAGAESDGPPELGGKEEKGGKRDGGEGDLEDAYVERIAVQSRGTVRIVSVEEITHITADGSYAELHTGEETHLIRERMKTLEERLHPEAFMRIHRSTIVRLEEVDAILRGGGGDYAVRLEDGTRLSLSRGRIDALKERLGVAGW